MHPIEAVMKACLDGTFTQVNPATGRSVTVVVPADYLPYHDRPPRADNGAANRSPRRMFTPDEDRRILALRAQRMTLPKIALALGRCPKSVFARWQRLRDNGVPR